MRNSRILLESALVLLSTFASAQTRYEGEKNVQKVKLEGKKIEQYRRINGEIQSNLYEIITKKVWKKVRVPITKCTSNPAYESDAWRRFFTARNSEKPRLLAQAVKGIGTSTAERLVDDGYFRSKPDTWSEFKREILRADREYETGFSEEVLVTYAEANRVSLGFQKSGDQTCEITYEDDFVLGEEEEKRFVGTKKQSYVLEIHNLVLLQNESVSLDVVYDGVDFNVLFSSGAQNSPVAFEFSKKDVSGTIWVQARAKRIRVSPENTLEVRPYKIERDLYLKVFDQGFDASLGGSLGELVMKVRVKKSVTLWFDKVLLEKTISLPAQASHEVKLGLKLDPGTKYYIQYSMQRFQSSFYNDNFSSRYQTKKYKF